MQSWLNENVGWDRWQTCSDIQPGRDATAFFFETLEAAAAFQAQFELELLFLPHVVVPGMRSAPGSE